MSVKRITGLEKLKTIDPKTDPKADFGASVSAATFEAIKKIEANTRYAEEKGGRLLAS